MKEKIGQLEAQLVRRTSARTALFTNAPDLYGLIFLVMAGDTGITDNRHILRAEPEDFAHVVVAHAALRRSGTSSPESSNFRSVWTLTPSNSAAFLIFMRGMFSSSRPHFPPRCGKSVTVRTGPSSRIQGQSQGAWR
jgi:hypothetical protein